MLVSVLLAAFLSEPGPFVLANASGGILSDLAIRPSDGSGSWRSMTPGALASGGRTAMPSPGGQLCAFDIRAKVGGTMVTWSSINLCDVKVVTLNRRSDGTLWVDYD
ncbi:hypothetical protein [Sphingomonas sp. LHG3406-1]|uniref:hypothetical protein n=1 Tax=Sphingomonas sp. LHG3406-1 TaxID=2804617 RepID=UPI0026185711|nr:hypothetical protein [Sphingomonas sp. LHG3406-1]